jgi:hypothetical protein
MNISKRMNIVHSDKQSEVCMETWLTCENALVLIPDSKVSEKQNLQKILIECANICLGMVHAIKNRSTNADKIALLCVGICEECAEACEKYFFHPLYRKCSMVCRRCADAMSTLALTSLA